MKKISKKLLSVLLVIAMLIPTGLLTVNSSGLFEHEEYMDTMIYFEVKKGSVENWNIYFDRKGIGMFFQSPQSPMRAGESRSFSFSVADVGTNIIYYLNLYYGVFNGLEVTSEFGGLSGDFEYYLSFTNGDTVFYESRTISSGGNVTVTHKFSEKSIIANGPQFPSDYNFEEDSYSFPNSNKKVDVEFYKTIYGDVKGTNLHKKYEKESHGVCFGMANTTASLINNRDLIYTFSYSAVESTVSADNIKSFQGSMISEYKSSELGISLLDYIKYTHITQYSSEVVNTHESNKNDLKGLFDAVSDFVNGNGQAVGIYVYNTKLLTKVNKHEILAVGISDEKDGYHIKINDSNNFYELTDFIISKDFTSWKYEIDRKNDDGSQICYNSENGGFSYGCWADLTYDTGWSANHIDSNRRLVVVTEDIVIENNAIEISDNIGNNTETVTSDNKAYWLDKDVTTAEITAIKDNTEVTISDVNSSVSIVLDSKENASFYVDDDAANEVTYSSKNNENANIVFTSVDEKGEIVTTTLTGTANGNEVTATETENGIQVTGLNGITVTYETADDTVETKADVKDGSTVNITVNDDENTVETDWQCKHADIDHDGICDSCGDDFTVDCGHTCHSNNAFVRFFYKIARFFWKLFGMQNKRICACGQAHW